MAAIVPARERFEIEWAINALNSAFTHHLDHGHTDALVALFTDDAVYTHAARRSDGKAQIAALFEKRAAGTPRTSRHICSGLKVEIQDSGHATGTSVCLSFAADGLPPLPAVPFLVADFIDSYRFDSQAGWRFATRHIERIFIAPDNAGPLARG